MDILPSLAPRDSHSLWYTSTHNSHNHSYHPDPSGNGVDHPGSITGHNNVGPNGQRRSNQALHRTPLVRLRLDEEYMERRKRNVQNYGSSWIKPPGIQKTLYQQQEEKRELEEHQEALRREQLAQELAEAEAPDDVLQGEGMDGDDMEEVRDLDDDVPDAETTGLDGDEDDEEDEEGDDLDHEDGEDIPRSVLAARLPDDVYREALLRGGEVRPTRFGDEGGSTVDEEDQSQMLQEEDLVHETSAAQLGMDADMDMDLGVDLDADIPDAESAGGYEHTDTDEELTSSDDESELPRFAGSQGPQAASSMVRSDGTQSSIDLDYRRIDLHGAYNNQPGSSPAPRSSMRGRGGDH